MQSRTGQGLYWMNRYLVRGGHLCRLLASQYSVIHDRSVDDIDRSWRRIYDALGREPLGGNLQSSQGRERIMLADAYTLTDDLTFERANTDSVWSCFSMGRENARQMRHCISGELWTSLNLCYLRIQKLSIQDIWLTSPEGFYADTAAEMDRFAGVAAATMYRDEGWRFMQLGRFIESSQMSTTLFLAQLDSCMLWDEYSEADWSSLLRVYHALEAYNHSYSVEVVPDHVLNLLTTDPLLPNSLCRSLDRTVSNLDSLSTGPNPRASGAARRLAGRMAALVHYDWPDTDDRRALLQRVRDEGRDLHHLVTQAYFDYPIEDSPGR